MPETTALGAAMAAGAAEGVRVWSLNPEDLSEVTSEKFEPQINPEGSTSQPPPSKRHDGRPSFSFKSLNSCVFAQRASFGTHGGKRRWRNPRTGRQRSL